MYSKYVYGDVVVDRIAEVGAILGTRGSWKEVPRLTMRATSDDCLRDLYSRDVD
jgi:hypothetical protein